VDGSVVQLEFYDRSTKSGNHVIGTIPNELTLLSDSLARLDLSSNGLMGTIPSEVGFLSALSFLSISSSPFSINGGLMGTIPFQVRFLSALTVLSLSDHSLTGSIPNEIGLLSNMNSLTLWYNNLNGVFTCPTFIDRCYISCNPNIASNVTVEACRSLLKIG
jgi:Leucine-rich repeat (LRR) protein